MSPGRVEGYAPLAYVEDEVANVRNAFPSVALVNEAFQRDTFEKTARNRAVGVVHIASHGEFLPNAEDSDLLTYDGRLSMGRLARGRTQCPGNAVAVNDEATAKIIDRSYAQLAGGTSRAKAIQTAQLSPLREPSFRHPIYWSAFLLISNWL